MAPPKSTNLPGCLNDTLRPVKQRTIAQAILEDRLVKQAVCGCILSGTPMRLPPFDARLRAAARSAIAAPHGSEDAPLSKVGANEGAWPSKTPDDLESGWLP